MVSEVFISVNYPEMECERDIVMFTIPFALNKSFVADAVLHVLNATKRGEHEDCLEYADRVFSEVANKIGGAYRYVYTDAEIDIK